jgi:Putative collagen-binding domain of a collagenase
VEQALDAPGAVQLGIFKKVFTDRAEWWRLVPAQDLIVGGGNTSGQLLTLAARHEEGRLAMAYVGRKAEFSIKMYMLAAGGGRVNAFWDNPRDGGRNPIGTPSSTGEHSLNTPEGWQDAVLVPEDARAV